MNILFIGQIVPDRLIKDCTGYSVAGDMMLKNIVSGLSSVKDVNVEVISVLPNASFPKDKVYISASEDTVLGTEIINLGYYNIPLIKQLSQERAIIECAKKKSKNVRYDCILCFNMYPQFGKAALKLQNYLNVPLVGILADLPVEMIDTYHGVNKLLFRLLRHITFGNIGKLKHGILLNENAKKYMHPYRDFIIIPGGVDNKSIATSEYIEVKEKRIVYAGALSEYSGIKNLIEAVIHIHSCECSLEIYGNGPLKEYIIEVSKLNPKIKYMGYRPIDEMRQIMRSAWILVNPRAVDDPVSSVTFPSKLFEYIMCKRPVITTEFSGMPEYIKELIYGCGAGSPEEIEREIQRIHQTDETELKRHTMDAYYYVLNNMNWAEQTAKMNSYIMEVMDIERGYDI